MPAAVVTLLTDFGPDSAYVAEMKGVILSLHADTQFVDITHSIPAQHIAQGARVLGTVAPRFPPNTIHLAVVDPGVGTDRRVVYARIAGQHFVAPDNGLLTVVSDEAPPERIIELTNRDFWLTDVSHTFHGRDILAPVAAYLARGLAPERLGRPCDSLERVQLSMGRVVGQTVEGSVVSFDSFGNLITDIRGSLLSVASPERAVAECRNYRFAGLSKTYASKPPGELIALIGSSGLLELAIVNGHAARALGIGLGDAVVVRW